MKTNRFFFKPLYFFILASAVISCSSPAEKTVEARGKNHEPIHSSDPLPSWNDGTTKQAIISFVKQVTTPDSPDFIPLADRIATFDNDGTLWSEKPLYFQFFFALDRIKAMAPQHPEWKTEEPFKAVLDHNMNDLMQQGEKGLLEIIMATHAGMTTDLFDSLVTGWISTAKHPTKNKLFTGLVYQPMLELIDYLKANGFKIFIVSGGGIEFMRPWSEAVYGIPKENVIGSSIKTRYDDNDGHPVILRLAEIDLIDDQEGKPVGINRYIGRKPVFACGNSDGDLQMLRWADSNLLPSFKLYIHHTDSIREWAYDRESLVGKLDKGLNEAVEKRWTITDMAKDWKVVYPFELNE